jgi:hypothetical protein
MTTTRRLRERGVFTTSDAAGDFSRCDPVVTNGLATKWEIHQWKDAL